MLPEIEPLDPRDHLGVVRREPVVAVDQQQVGAGDVLGAGLRLLGGRGGVPRTGRKEQARRDDGQMGELECSVHVLRAATSIGGHRGSPADAVGHA